MKLTGVKRYYLYDERNQRQLRRTKKGPKGLHPVKPADKDVTEGIRKVKSMPLYITLQSTNGFKKEIKSYKWRKDKEIVIGIGPVKFMDHWCDGLHMACSQTIKAKKHGFINFISY